MNLSNTKKDRSYKIKNIYGGRQFVDKMESMGILKGTTVQRVNANLGGGPIIIEVGNSQYALGRGMAAKIEVEEL
mgnify:CR=1 FL=1